MPTPTATPESTCVAGAPPATVVPWDATNNYIACLTVGQCVDIDSSFAATLFGTGGFPVDCSFAMSLLGGMDVCNENLVAAMSGNPSVASLAAGLYDMSMNLSADILFKDVCCESCS